MSLTDRAPSWRVSTPPVIRDGMVIVISFV
jgi:hypothetical protein